MSKYRFYFCGCKKKQYVHQGILYVCVCARTRVHVWGE